MLEGFTREAEQQQGTRRFLGDATRAQVEDRIRIQLTDRRTVRAFDVVGVDL